ncbi:MAG TPA: hypothetical protein VF062_19525 [Candidatus Limnocylindrales bacterium]
MDRLKQYAAALVVAALMAGVLWVVAQIAEKPAGPSYTPTGCAEGDRQCQEWRDAQESKEED